MVNNERGHFALFEDNGAVKGWLVGVICLACVVALLLFSWGCIFWITRSIWSFLKFVLAVVVLVLCLGGGVFGAFWICTLIEENKPKNWRDFT